MDITTNNGKKGWKVANTLAERIRRNFSRIKLRKASVKVPRLKFSKKDTAKAQNKNPIPISSIIKIIINNSVEELKKEAKKEKKADDSKPYRVIKEEKPESTGYGTASKSYGTAPQTSYADYGKMFSYLGKFRARNAYENFEAPSGQANSFLEQSSRSLVDFETMNNGARHVRYFIPAGTDFNTLSLVPVAGMSSGEWEQFKLWTKLDPVMYRFKTSTS